jgi:hypothetical protein
MLLGETCGGRRDDRLRLTLARLACGDVKRRRYEQADEQDQTESGQNHR